MGGVACYNEGACAIIKREDNDMEKVFNGGRMKKLVLENIEAFDGATPIVDTGEED